MTLVVGRIIQGMLRIDSDSKITDPNETSNNNSVFSGLLKTVILNLKISVSYAGAVDTAQKAIEQIFTSRDININNIKKQLLEIHIESGRKQIFLLHR